MWFYDHSSSFYDHSSSFYDHSSSFYDHSSSFYDHSSSSWMRRASGFPASRCNTECDSNASVCKIGSGPLLFEAVLFSGMRARAYVETSVPSFYFEARCESEMLARREWTRSWWNVAVKTTALTTSIAVVDELRRGEFPSRASCLELVARLPILAIDVAVLEIVTAYIRHEVMPAEPVGDALHLALASYYHCDFLVTWNCAHLANANKFGHIRRVNGLLGLATPAQVTPLELLGDDDEDRSSH